MTLQTRLLIASALIGGTLLAGCAGQEGPLSPNPSSSESTSSPYPTLSLTPDPGKPITEVTLTGTVEEMSIEGGCRVLRVDSNKSFELQGGDPAALRSGSRVTVRGKIRTDMVSICQVGPILEVISSQPA